MSRTLPQALVEQTRNRGEAIALVYKRHGAWHVMSWSALEAGVRRLAAALAHRGFVRGDALVVLFRHPSPQALQLLLAAQWLGGVAVPLDSPSEGAVLDGLVSELVPRFGFVENEADVVRLQDAVDKRGSRLATLVYADGRGLVHEEDAVLVSFLELAEEGAEREAEGASAVVSEEAALVGPAASATGEAGLPIQARSHGDLTDAGRELLRAFAIDQHDDVLVPRSLVSLAHHVLAPWLLAGFRLGFPETEATRDQDRRELSPTILLGTPETFQALSARVEASLPEATSWSRRLVDWALQGARGRWARALARLLVRRPLRRVLGLSRVSVALLTGDALEPRSASFFASLGIEPRPLDPTGGRRAATPDQRDGASADLAALPGARALG